MDNIEIKTYTAQQITDWIDNKSTTPSLSEALITKTRAAAIVNNPYMSPDDLVVAAIFHGNQPVTFTAIFPDLINQQPYVWFSTLWCHPDHRGKGYPLIAIGTLVEHYSPQKCLDSYGAPETIEIFKYFGHQNTFFPEYKHTLITPVPLSIKKTIKCCIKKSWAAQIKRKKLKQHIGGTDYVIEYTNKIDNPTYNFIQQHANKDLFPRTREMLNWILSNPFKHTAPLIQKTENINPFPDNEENYWLSGITIKSNNQIVGFYIIRCTSQELSVKYLYYSPQHTNLVFNTILHHILKLHSTSFTTRSLSLSDYINSYSIFNHRQTIQISYSLPSTFPVNPAAQPQGGDGDAFV